MKIKVEINLDVPEYFEGSKSFSKIQSLDDYIEHWLFEGYWICDGIVTLPQNIQVDNYNIVSFPEDWWKELIPKNEWAKEKPKLIKKGLILKNSEKEK